MATVASVDGFWKTTEQNALFLKCKIYLWAPTPRIKNDPPHTKNKTKQTTTKQKLNKLNKN
jgi:hypothetical protein